MSAIDALGKARYVNLETFRKNGTGVQTPVWVAPDGGELVIFTNGDSYKVKRLRRNSKVRIAECNVRGALKGPWHDGTARFVDDEAGKQSVLRALHKKYGWQMTLADWGGRLRGSKKDWVFIAVRVGGDE
ncbi:MAG: PPOX class F420-dependent oxidoreductase [Myxococcales bacterium]|nr:MAG: PPOX class F420-dependent oxidoreductase [Myxococcales bacterium]